MGYERYLGQQIKDSAGAKHEERSQKPGVQNENYLHSSGSGRMHQKWLRCLT